jgi:nucleoside-diphosphate-sugar epimerase
MMRCAFGPYHSEPINVGSGLGISIRDLAKRIIAEAGSNSPLLVQPARCPEVRRFVADIARARRYLNLQPPADPLEGLPELIKASYQESARSAAVV